MGIKHSFSSLKIDGPDTSVVRPSNWNADHVIDGDVNLNGNNIIISGTLGIYSGSGAPAFSAGQGSLYLRTDGTTLNDRIYVNSGGASWVALAAVG